ncbi:hypothetical protein JXI42_00345 [bacterium]|nr:hypothetical protein [bacterium]
MSVLAQCGWGRGGKIERGLNDGVINGVIMSPRDETPDRLENIINQWGQSYPGAIVLFDPQFYVANLNAPRDGHLGEYDYYNNNSGLGRAQFSGTRIRNYVRECLDYQHDTFGNNLTNLVSPSILFDGFRDNWSQIALNLAAESADYHDSGLGKPQPLLISIVVSETAFQAIDAVEEFLDALTELNVAGFYIIVRRNANSPQFAMEPRPFANFLYFCYVLSEINEYKVIVGYSDWQSFLLEAVGASNTACGWYQNLKQFSLDRFRPSLGGQTPRKRYSSAPLLSCPLINPELEDIYSANLLSSVLSGSNHDSLLIGGPLTNEPAWTNEVSCLAHWFSLTSLSHRILAQTGIENKLRVAELIMQDSALVYQQLRNQGINFDTQTDQGHILDWQTAIREFRTITRIYDANEFSK